MKGLAIYTIVILGILDLGFIYNIIEGSADGYQVFLMLMLIPIMVFACIYVSRNK